MEITLPLEKMTVSEKLRVLEEIWENLCLTPEEVPSPSWHADVLEARDQGVCEGSSEFHSWDEAKKSIRGRAR